MARFRKRPVEIDACRLGWDNWHEMCSFAGVGELKNGKPQGCYVNDAGEGTDQFPGGDAKIGLWIPTLEGLMLATEGDWVIRGVQGELYPCKPDIFVETYEPVL